MTNKFSFITSKVKTGVAIACMALAITVTTKITYAESITPSIVFNGSELALSQSSIIQDSRMLVPLHDIWTELGADVLWDANTEIFTAVKDNIKVTIQIGSNILTRNGEKITLDVPTQFLDGKAMVPLYAVAESLGMEVNWDASTMTALMGEKK